jgi:hypothetical protein
MRRSYVVPMRWMVIYEYEVPGGALNLNSTKLPRPWSPLGSSPSRKNPDGRTGNRTRDLMISSQKLWPLDHDAGPISLVCSCLQVLCRTLCHYYCFYCLFYNYLAYVFNSIFMFVFVFYFFPVFLYCLCVIYILFLLLYLDVCFPIFVQDHRPLPPGGTPIAVSK